ncbi:UBP-type zinc finger domain-containing protein [Algoriphagus namhaensis]|uniref:UBP-type zinc finger domain-containing protein n=1 Tax=Algoriphagus namhaensis TaxID=915353 RepID=A0ABV8AQQ4_9BACT
MKSCSHLDQALADEVKNPKSQECAECVKTGDEWVHLRTCQSCGITLCCDSSKNQHASAHFAESKHPVIASAEQGERWLYCYEDELFMRY